MTDTAYDAMMECFKVLGQPLMIHDEGALNSKKAHELFKTEGITHVVTKHANQAERAIRTLKKNDG